MKISADFLRLRVERSNMNNVETGNMNIYLVSNIYICMVFLHMVFVGAQSLAM